MPRLFFWIIAAALAVSASGCFDVRALRDAAEAAKKRHEEKQQAKAEENSAANARSKDRNPRPKTEPPIGLTRTSANCWVNNGSGQTWTYRIDGRSPQSLPPYALRPVDVSRGSHEFAFDMGGRAKAIKADVAGGDTVTVINPDALDTFVIRWQVYTANPSPLNTHLGPTSRSSDIRAEVITRKVNFGLDEAMPMTVNMNIMKGREQHLTKIYKKYPDPTPAAMAIDALTNHPHAYYGGTGKAIDALGQSDSPQARGLLEKCAFREDDHAAAAALFTSGAYELLARRWGELPEGAKSRIANQFQRQCRDEGRVPDELLPILWQGLEEEERIRGQFLETALSRLPKESPHYDRVKSHVRADDEALVERLGRAEERRAVEMINDADLDTLVRLAVDYEDEATVDRVFDRLGWKKKEEKHEFMTKLGQALAGMSDTARRDLIYGKLIALVENKRWGAVAAPALQKCMESEDPDFALHAANDLLAKAGEIDRRVFEFLKEQDPDSLTVCTEAYKRGLNHVMGDKNADRLWTIQAVDMLGPSARRDQLIKNLGYRMAYTVEVPELLAAVQTAKDRELRRSVYKAMDFRIKTAGKTDRLIELIKAEPDAELRQTLARHL